MAHRQPKGIHLDRLKAAISLYENFVARVNDFFAVSAASFSPTSLTMVGSMVLFQEDGGAHARLHRSGRLLQSSKSSRDPG